MQGVSILNISLLNVKGKISVNPCIFCSRYIEAVEVKTLTGNGSVCHI